MYKRQVIKRPVRFACCARCGERISPRSRALRAGRCTLGRLFGLRDAARRRNCRYDIAHCMRDKVHVINSWQSSCTRLEISVSQRQNSISCTGPGASAHVTVSRAVSSPGLKERQSRMSVSSVSLGADRCAARTRPVAWPMAPPERPGSRRVQGVRARCGRRCCCRAGRALRGPGG